MITIGIDLGTNNTTCCYSHNGRRAKLVFDSYDYLPSMVRIEKDENGEDSFSFGQALKKQMHNYADSIVYGSKRLLGKTFNNSFVQKFKETSSVPIVNCDDKPVYLVNGKQYKPEFISAQILSEVKRKIFSKIGKEPEAAVITVPALFNINQRTCTQTAAEIAGLKVLQLISEPTAAALAFKHLVDKSDSPKTVLIFDFGAGTLDVSIVRYSGNRFNVIAVEGNTTLGGQDFDRELYEFVLNKYLEKYPDFDINSKKNLKPLLVQACEECKIQLSDTKSAQIIIPNFNGTESLEMSIRRTNFAKCIEKYLNEAEETIHKALEKAKLSVSQIDHIIPTGGTSLVPAVQDLLTKIFGDDKVTFEIDVIHAVAQGAQILCEGLNSGQTIFTDAPDDFFIKKKNSGIVEIGDEKQIIKDINPLPFGFRYEDHKFYKYFSAGMALPKEISYPFEVNSSGVLELDLYQGNDSENCLNNELVAQIKVPNIPPNVKNLWVRMKLDTSGMLGIYIQDTEGSVEKEIKIEVKVKLPQEVIDKERKITEEAQHKRDLVESLDSRLEEISDKLSKAKARKGIDRHKYYELEEKVDEIIENIDINKNNLNISETAKQIEELEKEVNDFLGNA